MSLSPPPHRGAAMDAITELEARSVILRGLHELASDEEAIARIVARTDRLLYGSQADCSRELRNELLAMLTPESDRYITVEVGWPTEHAHLPYVSLVNAGGGENDAETVIGDQLGDASFEVFGDFVPLPTLDSGLRLTPTPGQVAGTAPTPKPVRIEEVRTIGVGWRTQIEVGSWHVAPEGSVLLQAMVRWALFRGKRELEAMGVHELSLSDGGVMPDERLEPRVAYVPTTTLTLLWTYTQVRRREAIPGNVSCTTTFSV